MSRRIVVVLLAAAAVAAVAGGVAAGLRERATQVVVQPAATPTPAPAVTPTPSATAPQAAPTPSPPPTSTPAATPTPEGVAAVQQQLTDLGYYVGPVDGEAGPATASAVTAFQKVNGLTPDGVIGPDTLAALAAPRPPDLRGGPPTRIEVDLDRQVLHLVQDGRRTRTLPISSGNGETYTTASGGTARSVTPVGQFTIERHIRGVRNAPLGTLYDPLYFHRGWAIHGSNSVPPYPASHGCVRVTRADAVWLFDRAPIGTPVIVHGSTHSFDPRSGESAGTDVPAGDTADTTPADGIQTEEPRPEADPGTPPTASPAPTPAPTAAPAPPTESEPAPPPGPTPDPTPDPTVPDPSTRDDDGDAPVLPGG